MEFRTDIVTEAGFEKARFVVSEPVAYAIPTHRSGYGHSLN